MQAEPFLAEIYRCSSGNSIQLAFSGSEIIHQVLILWTRRFFKISFNFFVFSLGLVSIEKIYQILQTVFHRISEHLEVLQKYPSRRVFSSLLGVWNFDETLWVLFDIFYILVMQHFRVVYLTITLRARVFYEQPSWLSLVENEGEQSNCFSINLP